MLQFPTANCAFLLVTSPGRHGDFCVYFVQAHATRLVRVPSLASNHKLLSFNFVSCRAVCAFPFDLHEATVPEELWLLAWCTCWACHAARAVSVLFSLLLLEYACMQYVYSFETWRQHVVSVWRLRNDRECGHLRLLPWLFLSDARYGCR